MHALSYEYRIDDIDSALPSNLRYDLMTTNNMVRLVDSVDVYLYCNLDRGTTPFICPSGLGIRPGEFLDGQGSLFRYHIDRSNGLNVRVRW